MGPMRTDEIFTYPGSQNQRSAACLHILQNCLSRVYSFPFRISQKGVPSLYMPLVLLQRDSFSVGNVVSYGQDSKIHTGDFSHQPSFFFFHPIPAPSLRTSKEVPVPIFMRS